MKDTLTLEDLAPYLPYGLKWMPIVLDRYRLNDFWDYVNEGYQYAFDLDMVKTILECWEQKEPFKQRVYAKPILRPLSGLTKEIEHNGERFVPWVRLCEKWGEDPKVCRLSVKMEDNDVVICGQKTASTIHLSVNDWDQIYAWHFDARDLIGRGLAIDINTLKK